MPLLARLDPLAHPWTQRLRINAVQLSSHKVGNIAYALNDQPFDVLMISSRDNGTSVFVNPNEMESASTYKPNLSFGKVEEQHFLSGIQTADYVYNFPVSRSVTLAAAAKPRDTVSVSGSGGSN